MSKNVHYIMTFSAAAMRAAAEMVKEKGYIAVEQQEHKVMSQEGESPGAAAMRAAAEMVKEKGYIAVEQQEHKVMSQEGESPGAAAMRAAAEMAKKKRYNVREWKRAGVCQTDDGWLLSCFVASIITDSRDLQSRCVHVAVKY